ncbi:DUF6279 family lipoprotein [Roseateles sp. LYH14W]|uniref:DUF6279 family lipoprotein n=1 Tax=Pelomonas parva TaxID=3299032 RepID=A0ABW7F286_9BURK
MPLLKRIASLLLLAVAVGLAGCSSLTLAYQQLPLLAGLWADGYLDLDGPQRDRLKEQLQAWQAWHRREELPQLQALLRQAHAALDDGVTRDELLALERGARASAERSLQQAAPLAGPLLATLKPEQWQHLQKELDEKTADWREKQGGSGGPDERAKRYLTSLERWLGDLDRNTLRQARADAEGWPFDLPALAQGRATRQARTVEGLRAWSRQEQAAGTALMMQNLLPLPAEQPLREQIIASVLKLLNGLSAEQREEVRKHWADLAAQLRAM